MSKITMTHVGVSKTVPEPVGSSSLSKGSFKIIRVTPTLSTDAYAQGDVLFTATEIENAVKGDGGCSKLLGMYIVDQSDIADSDITFVFSEGSTALGTINATANISDANLEDLGINGICTLDSDQAETGAHIDTARIFQVLPASGTGESSNASMLLQAATGSTSVYVQGILTSSTTPTYAADDIDLVLHIQY
jgi:hypothetical protein